MLYYWRESEIKVWKRLMRSRLFAAQRLICAAWPSSSSAERGIGRAEENQANEIRERERERFIRDGREREFLFLAKG